MGETARASKQETGAIGSESGEGVADGALEIVLQRLRVIGKTFKEGNPGRRLGLGIVGEGDEASEVVLGIVRREGISAEIEGTVEDREEEGVGVEDREGDSDTRKSSGESEEGGETRERGAMPGVFEELFAEGSIFVGQGEGIVAVRLERGGSESKNLLGVVEVPAKAIEEEPANGRGETDLVTEVLDEAAGVAQIIEFIGRAITERQDTMIVGRG